MTANYYDVIVVGVGSMGAATCSYLAAKGCKVLGLEQFDIVPHENGSHAGQSRIIRKAYFEHPDYIPLLQKAYVNWHKLEQATGEQVYYKTGLLYLGPADHKVIHAVKEAAINFNIVINNAEGHSCLNAFTRKDDTELILEHNAGFLLPEKSISLYIGEAKKSGADIQTGEKVIEWSRNKGLIKVQTNKGTYSAPKLIITTGAWADKLIKKLAIPLKVTRQVVIWAEPANSSLFLPEKFPCWLAVDHSLKGAWYGFPYLSGAQFPEPTGLKFALHYPADETDPDQVNREVTNIETQSLIELASKYFFPATGKIVAVKTCLYTNTPDENFIIDRLPGYEDNVMIACGFSGHGFKFASVVGEILADLTLEGRTELPIEFLTISRFSN